MVAQAKKRELKEAQKKKKQLEDRCKLEESIGTAVQTWNQDILPNWSAMCTSRRVRDLWWQGIPPSVRGKVWSLASGQRPQHHPRPVPHLSGPGEGEVEDQRDPCVGARV
ncbi:hypothetical protein fugu_001576 [Takifugu bimaculatus]|uniref:Rab-GAP TBC domain-containing protein n=1 Tax=Takifugu bimaculatus TaxID=433685 RepID=A0A4Z2BQ58_9TELE|nr:hypothetical protein fugu_001576 [Takifugu bimaculatus]